MRMVTLRSRLIISIRGRLSTNGDHKHQVTYGKEISETTEYTDMQKWYYDVDGYGAATGLVYAKSEDKETEKSFAAWLPYVAVPYNAGNKTHEIKVNQRVYDIVDGCGTYGHPYVITSAGDDDYFRVPVYWNAA